MPDIHLKTNKEEYKFNITEKYNLVRGDSGLGKTSFYDLVDLYSVNHRLVQCPGYSKIVSLQGRYHLDDFIKYENYVFVIDEDNPLLHRNDVASILRKSNNYFIIICRKYKFGFLPINLDAIFMMKSSGRFHTLVPQYTIHDNVKKSDVIICEDSKSGYLFISQVMQDTTVDVQSSELQNNGAGASKLLLTLNEFYSRGIKRICLVLDKAGIGTLYDAIYIFENNHSDLQLSIIDWQSFEHYILSSKIYDADLSAYGLPWESIEQFSENKIKDYIPNYKKGLLPLCLQRDRCYNCKSYNTCKYHGDFHDLIYGKVEKLYDSAQSVGSKVKKLSFF